MRGPLDAIVGECVSVLSKDKEGTRNSTTFFVTINMSSIPKTQTVSLDFWHKISKLM